LDIANWLRKVKSGGILCGDDYDWEGVQKAVHEAFQSNVIIEPRNANLDCTRDIYAGNYWKYNVI
jgi:hypothetical protein